MWKEIRNSEKKSVKKNDRIFLAVVFLLLLVTAAVFYLIRGNGGARVKVTVDGDLYGTYSLYENQEIPISKGGVTTNVLVIRDGTADVTEADCPDKLCVHQRAISKTGETIVCLPNKVVVEVLGSEDSEVDSVAK